MSTTTILRPTGGSLEREFEELFSSHCEFVYRTAYSVLRNRPDAEDVLQNLFLKLIERELPLELSRNPQAYLYRAAVNLALNVVRSRKHEVTTNDFRSFDTQTPDTSFEHQDDRRQKLIKAIEFLRPKAAEV